MKRGRRKPNVARRKPRGRLRWTRALALVAVGAAAGALATQGGTGMLASADPRPVAKRLLEKAPRERPELPEVGALIRHPRLQLRHVDFLGLEALEARRLLRALPPARPLPLADVDPEQVCEALLAETPRIQTCSALRVLPDRLLVRVRERVPIAALGARTGIDAEGARFEISGAEATALPLLAGPGRERPAVRALATAARERGIALRAISAGGPGELWFEPRDRPLRVRAGRDPAAALAAWRRLVRSGWLATYPAGEVDLRFRGAAVLRELRNEKGGREDGSS